MSRLKFLFNDKKLRKQFPNQIDTWNKSVLSVLTKFFILNTACFLSFCLFFKNDWKSILVSIFFFILSILIKILCDNKIVQTSKRLSIVLLSFWGLMMFYLSVLNFLILTYTQGYLFGLFLIFLGLIIQSSFSTAFLMSTISIVQYFLVGLFFNHNFTTGDYITIAISYSMVLIGTKIISVTRTVELENLSELHKLSTLDPLTKLLNRRTIEFLISTKLSQKDYGYFFIIDLDNFKTINDNQGHLTGDLVLKELATILKKNLSENSLVGRVGGDEFIVYSTDLSVDEALHYSKTIQTQINNRFNSFSDDDVSISIGISKGREEDTYSSIFARADLALYDVKMSGKRSHSLYKGNDELNQERPVMLIVDDTFIARKLLENYFEDEFKILQAENGEVALNLLSYNKVSIILLDMKMPVMDGMAFFEEFNKNEKWKKIPVVVISSDPTLEVEALQKGAADMIVKPFDANIVKMRVKNVLNHSH